MSNTIDETKPMSYETFLRIKGKKDSPEEQWLYGEYLANFEKACPK